VSGLSGIVAIAAGSGQNLALKSDGTVWAWSNGVTSAQVSGLSGITSIAMGSGHNLALKSDGTVWSWGTNSSG
ncbi:regulator, partial [Paenibacillus sp. CGMCC 1.18879]|nr:regulator [Paenibacillus sp. CGMCC 1.18879]